MSKPLTPTQIKRRAEWARLQQSLAPRKATAYHCAILQGPYNVKRGTGMFGST